MVSDKFGLGLVRYKTRIRVELTTHKPDEPHRVCVQSTLLLYGLVYKPKFINKWNGLHRKI